MYLKKGDKVRVIAGNDKGTDGKIIKVVGDKVVVEGVHIVTKHIKPKNNGGNGEIVKVEAPIHASNVMLIDKKTNKTTRIAHIKNEKGTKVRVSKKSNEKFD
ncbi:MAG: 50S ribosomal protein L24 [bacterium]|nr:50S ribosomal protein L24 [bacterium]